MAWMNPTFLDGGLEGRSSWWGPACQAAENIIPFSIFAARPVLFTSTIDLVRYNASHKGSRDHFQILPW